MVNGNETSEASPSSEIPNCLPQLQNTWIQAQDSLKRKLVTEDDFTWKLPTTTKNSRTSKHEGEEECCRLVKYVGGVDLSFLKEDSSMACGTLVVLDLQTLQAVYEDSSVVRLSVPYVPGFLAFREAPVLLELLEKMKNNSHPFYPQLLMVDGNGLLHPRGNTINTGFTEANIHFSWSPYISYFCHQNCEINLQVPCSRAHPPG